MYIVIAILAFGILIAIHEFGHFIAAKSCGVKVNEFSIGMGPQILHKQGKETLYSLRLLPIGGYCAMEGEDEDTGDERAFTRQSAWKKAIILAAGPLMNFVLGFIIVLILYAGSYGFYTPEVVSVREDAYSYEDGLREGDIITSLDGHAIYLKNDVTMFLSRAKTTTIDMTVKRDGEKTDLRVRLTPYEDEESGETTYMLGITLGGIEEATVLGTVKYAWFESIDFVRMVWMSLADLVTGAVGLDSVSGVVGVVSVINDVGQQSETVAIALENIAYLCAFIAVNLAVMNLLPIPALDGGRLFLLLADVIAEKVFRRKISPKVEMYVNAAGMVLLLGLMAVLVVKDVWALFAQ